MFELSNYPLAFKRDALAPFMSAETIDFHYGKHLDTYIKNLNGFIDGTDYAALPLIDIIKKSFDEKAQKIFNNAAQVFNHNFFFEGLEKDSVATAPTKIISHFGSLENFKKEFKAAAVGVFGSGWAWLVLDAGELKIVQYSNADTPIAHGAAPVLCLDVWEHAYYLDYQNRRADFADAFLEHLINWKFVAGNL